MQGHLCGIERLLQVMLNLRLPGLISTPRSAAFAVSNASTLDFMAYLKDAYLTLEMALKVDIVVIFGNGMVWNYNSVVLRKPGSWLLSRPIRKTARWSAGDEYCPRLQWLPEFGYCEPPVSCHSSQQRSR